MRRSAVLSAAAILGIAATLASGAQAASTKAEKLAVYAEAIRTAATPSDAMAAYARGRAVDRESVALHEAYLRRMLRFGLPQIARYAADVLAGGEGEHGLAWGVLGYEHAREGRLGLAFAETVLAAARDGDNPGILHNIGQLVAWYEQELELPRIPDAARRTLDRIRPRLEKQEAFTRAYEATKVAYEQGRKLTGELLQQVSLAETDVLATQESALEIDRQLQDIAAEIDDHYRRIDILREELRYAYSTSYGYYVPRGYYYGPGGVSPTIVQGSIITTRRSTQIYRDELNDRIRQEQRAVADLQARARRLRAQGAVIVGQLDARQQRLERLRRQSQAAMTRAQQRFRWDPPAVDGEITPRLERMPLGTGRAPALPDDPETSATQRLKVAELYLTNDMPEKGLAILAEVVEQYPDTPAGRDAAKLLARLRAER